MALNGYGWTLKDPLAEAIVPFGGTQPSASEEMGCFHARWSLPPHMHYLASQGAPMVKALLTLSTQW